MMERLKKLETDCKDALAILNELKPGDDPTDHFKLQELLSRIKTSNAKIKKSIEDETDESKICTFPSSQLLSALPLMSFWA